MAAPVALDQELELRIDSLAFGGNGVARLDGFVLFVRRGLPGDLVRARVTKVKRNHAEAVTVDVLEPGPVREQWFSLGSTSWTPPFPIGIIGLAPCLPLFGL